MRSLGMCSCVNKQWASIATAQPVWLELGKLLWKGRYFPQHVNDLRSVDARTAYRLSVEDAARNTLTIEELTSFQWEFRFKRYDSPSH